MTLEQFPVREKVIEKVIDGIIKNVEQEMIPKSERFVALRKWSESFPRSALLEHIAALAL